MGSVIKIMGKIENGIYCQAIEYVDTCKTFKEMSLIKLLVALCLWPTSHFYVFRWKPKCIKKKILYLSSIFSETISSMRLKQLSYNYLQILFFFYKKTGPKCGCYDNLEVPHTYNEKI